jgi:hypothetical protein
MTKISKSAASEEVGDPPILALSTIAEARTFSDLVLLASGRYPTELLELLRGCDHPDRALQRHVQALIDDATMIVPGNGHPQGAGLALPHPMDAEWRFTDGTADDLLAAAVDATNAGETILLMGVPSVVIAALRSRHDRLFSVIGEHNVISDELRSLTAKDDRFDHDDAGQRLAAAAILDPPWYLHQFCGMLSEAASRCAIGAHVLLSAPSETVRPSIRDDLRQIDATASQCSLELVDHVPGMLGYRTPFFEMNALRASGIGAWLPEWRRGSKRVYRKNGHGRALVSKLPVRSGFEVTLSGVRLRLLNVAQERATTDLVPIHPGEIFPTVSMRAPRRTEAVLWTSGNRAFSVEHKACLAALVTIAEDRRLLPEGLYPELSPVGNPMTIDRISPLIQKLLELAEREFAEATNLLGSEAWETAANDARFLSDSREAPL